ncbi:MAG: DnaJ domain-containing protein [Xanthobacteraceae bacterium]
MAAFLFGVAALLLVLGAISAFTKADPKQVALLLRWIGGGAALAVAGVLLFRGAIAIAIPLGAFGLGLLGWTSLWPASFTARTQRRTGQVSQVRTAFLEMELDHDTGAMRGRVIAGSHQGASLDALDRAALVNLLREVDDDSRDLLAAYLDRMAPGWREQAQHESAGGSGPPPAGGGKMTEQEACQILGIKSGASKEEITRAHRSLIKKLHPDQGGTTYLAARINEAKDVLLRRHR